jgi:hypothetical protein
MTSSNFGLLDGQVAGLGAFEKLVDVGRGASKRISRIRSIGHETPGIDKLSQSVHCRQPVAPKNCTPIALLTPTTI